MISSYYGPFYILNMSHFSKIKTSLRDLALLQKSLDDLGVRWDENIKSLNGYKSQKCFANLVTQGGTVTTTVSYGCVCTANTVTITALTNAGTTDTTDTSLINYWIAN